MITTAQVPGRRPPLLVTEDALKEMTAGSVIVDMGASPLGGNVVGSVPGQTIVTENGVTIVGASALPSTMPAAASAMYARNVSALLLYLVKDGAARARPRRRAAGRSHHQPRREGRPPRASPRRSRPCTRRC